MFYEEVKMRWRMISPIVKYKTKQFLVFIEDQFYKTIFKDEFYRKKYNSKKQQFYTVFWLASWMSLGSIHLHGMTDSLYSSYNTPIGVMVFSFVLNLGGYIGAGYFALIFFRALLVDSDKSECERDLKYLNRQNVLSIMYRQKKDEEYIQNDFIVDTDWESYYEIESNIFGSVAIQEIRKRTPYGLPNGKIQDLYFEHVFSGHIVHLVVDGKAVTPVFKFLES